MALAEHGFAAGVAARVRALKEDGGYAWSTDRTRERRCRHARGAASHEARVVPPAGTSLIPAWYVEVQVTRCGSPRRRRLLVRRVGDRRLAPVPQRPRHRRRVLLSRVRRKHAALPAAAGPRWPRRLPASDRHARRLPAAVRDAQPRHAARTRRSRATIPGSRGAANRTHGNNVEAFINNLAPDGFGTPGTDECNVALPIDGDLHACVTSPNTFDHTYNHDLSPTANRTQVAAAVTNLFYTINYLHDWFYDAGFDEALGQRADQQLRPRRHRQRQHLRRGAGLHRHATTRTCPRRRTASARACACTCGRAACRWSRCIAPASIAGVKTVGDGGVRRAGVRPDRTTSSLALDAANSDGPDHDRRLQRVHQRGRRRRQDRRHRPRHLPVRRSRSRTRRTAGAVGVHHRQQRLAGRASAWPATIPPITIPVAVDHAGRRRRDQGRSSGRARRDAAHGPPGGAAARRRVRQHASSRTSGATTFRNRLVGNANGLVANQARGMGEGWADFVALLLFVEGGGPQRRPPTPTSTAPIQSRPTPSAAPTTRPTCSTTRTTTASAAIRTTRDMTKNPLTFKHIADGVPAAGRRRRSRRAAAAP